MICALVFDKNILLPMLYLVHLTDKIREQLDSGNFACETFIYLQNASDTVDYDFLSKNWITMTLVA